MLLIVAALFDVVFFDGNHFIVVVIVAVVVYFECVDFVVFTAGIDVSAIHKLFVDCVPAIVEIVVVVVVADLR